MSKITLNLNWGIETKRIHNQVQSQRQGLSKDLTALGKAVAIFCALGLLNTQVAKANAPTAPGSRLSIMTFNTENFFDTQHDPGKQDEPYLPLAQKQNPAFQNMCKQRNPQGGSRLNECLYLDWSDAVYNEKLKRVASVITQANSGFGPDILITEEVENIGVLQTLNQRYLQNSGYRTIALIEGPDPRGIDIGVMSRLPLASNPTYHIIQFQPEPGDEGTAKSTRGIIQVDLVMPNKDIMTVFGLHLPSQAHRPYLRAQAIQYLNALKASLPKDRLVVVGGDFNITATDDTQTGIISKVMGSSWLISHKMGCNGCKGSIFYNADKTWSFFDILGFSENFAANVPGNWLVDTSSIHLITTSPYQVDPEKSNPHFNPKSQVTVSDHLPMYAEIYLRGQ